MGKLYGVTAKKVQGMQPELYQKMLQHAASVSIDTFMVDGVRTNEEQTALWQKGRDSQGNIIDKSKIVTNAKAGQSPHNYGAAYDLAPYDAINGKILWNRDDLFKYLADVGQGLGLTAGRYFRNMVDSPHFEIANFWDKVKSGLLKPAVRYNISLLLALGAAVSFFRMV